MGLRDFRGNTKKKTLFVYDLFRLKRDSMKRGTMTKSSKITAVFLLFFLWQCLPLVGGKNHQRWSSPWRWPQTYAYAQEGSEQEDRPTLEWFKKELRISSKYRDRDVGILGLSWAHFLVMVFLTVFFLIALVALIVRYNRTKELVSMLVKEEKTGGEKG